MIRLVLGLVCLVHGIAHLVGFFAAWRPSAIPELPHKTTVLSGRIDLGEGGIRAVGIIWLLLALAFAAAGVMVWLTLPQATTAVFVLSAASFVMSLIAWPDSQIGVVVNLAIALFVFGALRYGWM